VRRFTRVLLLLLLALAASLRTARTEEASPADLKSKDWRTRLEAVEALRKGSHADAESLLVGALKDDDWEVAERAAQALAEKGGPDALKRLTDAAVGGRVRRLRLAAARALGRIDPEAAAKAVAKDVRREEAERAAFALCVIAQEAGDRAGDLLRKGLVKCWKSKEAPVRAAAAGAFGAFPLPERLEHLGRLLEDEDLTVVAAALAETRRRPDPAYLPLLLDHLGRHPLNDVIERRVLASFVATLGGLGDADAAARHAGAIGGVIADAKEGAVAARAARLLGMLGAAPPAPEEPPPAPGSGPEGQPPPPAPVARGPVVAPEAILPLLEGALAHKSETARAEGVKALGALRTPAALDRAAALAVSDPHPRPRIQGLRATAAGRGLSDGATLALLAERLRKDPDPGAREEAAVLLGAPGPEGAPFDAPAEALEQATQDAEWTVAAVAAVSLGKTRSLRGVAALERMTNPKTTKDWRRRGAAVVGLGRMKQREAVPGVIAALEDKDPYVRRTAFEFLRRLTAKKIPPIRSEWDAWWARIGPTFEFIDYEKVARELKKGGYAVKPIEVYDEVGTAKLDVVVLQSRGDHIERLLEDLVIEHRVTRAAQVAQAELHPFAVFVSNCTGEVQEEDVERLQWFVRVGGYLFCSCWALHHTVEPVCKGWVRKLPTKAEVLDNVVAEKCPVESRYLEGVFPDFTQPIYVLFGSHLIEVLEPERVEVLIDSPEAATRHGGGNLACWFPFGHGVVLDSANHFDLQGLERVVGLKTAEDRMAYAMDHMGLDYEDLRKLAKARVWESQADSVRTACDLSAFRFITNFARHKRRTDP